MRCGSWSWPANGLNGIDSSARPINQPKLFDLACLTELCRNIQQLVVQRMVRRGICDVQMTGKKYGEISRRSIRTSPISICTWCIECVRPFHFVSYPSRQKPNPKHYQKAEMVSIDKWPTCPEDQWYVKSDRSLAILCGLSNKDLQDWVFATQSSSGFLKMVRGWFLPSSIADREKWSDSVGTFQMEKSERVNKNLQPPRRDGWDSKYFSSNKSVRCSTWQ